MNRFTISISALLILSLPGLSQHRPTSHKRVRHSLLAKRTGPTDLSPTPTADSTQSNRNKPLPTPDSIRRIAPVVSALPYQVVSASAAVRTSPEVVIQPQNIIRSYYVDLAYNKTVSIIFPTGVRSVDLGSRSIIADKAADVENVLKVKAAQIGFNETNFSVMTADGTFYSFVVNYNETPGVLALNLTNSAITRLPHASESVALADRTQFLNGVDAQGGHIQFAGVKATQSDIVYASDQMLRHRGRGRRGDKADKMTARLRGLSVNENVLYCRLELTNQSNHNYDIDYVRFFVVDSKTARLTSRQELELRPIYVHNEAITTVHGHQQIERVYAFQRFTIPNNKQLLVQIGEQNGGRNLSFVIENKDITDARLL